VTADPTGFDRLVLAAVGAPTAAPETAGDLAVLMVEAEGLRRENADLHAERDRWRRIAMDQADRLAAAARADVRAGPRGADEGVGRRGWGVMRAVKGEGR